jgi:hypothetical protein
MTYEIRVPSGITVPSDCELFCDNPKSIQENLQELQDLFPRVQFQVLRDGTAISASQLADDLESHAIAQVREESCELPSTYRRGWSNTTDEVAKDAGGNPTKVWDPENPEDRFDLPFRPKPKS